MKTTNPSCSIDSLACFGPVFGQCDITIANNSNENKKSFSNLGNIYKHPQYPKGSNEALEFLAGSFHFQLSEIEVYKREF